MHLQREMANIWRDPHEAGDVPEHSNSASLPKREEIDQVCRSRRQRSAFGSLEQFRVHCRRLIAIVAVLAVLATSHCSQTNFR